MKTISFVLLAMVLPSALFVAASLLINGELVALPPCNKMRAETNAQLCFAGTPYHPNCNNHGYACCPKEVIGECEDATGPCDYGKEAERVPLNCEQGATTEHCENHPEVTTCFELWICLWVGGEAECAPNIYCYTQPIVPKYTHENCEPAQGS